MKILFTLLFTLISFPSWAQTTCPGENFVPGQITYNTLDDLKNEIGNLKKQDQIKYEDSNVEPEWLELSLNDRFYDLSGLTIQQLKWQVLPPLSNIYNPVLESQDNYLLNFSYQNFLTSRKEVLALLDELSQVRDAAVYDGKKEAFITKQISYYQFEKSISLLPLTCTELKSTIEIVSGSIDTKLYGNEEQTDIGNLFTTGHDYQVRLTYNRIPLQNPLTVEVEVGTKSYILKVSPTGNPTIFMSQNFILEEPGATP